MRLKIGILILGLSGLFLPFSVEAGSKVYNGSDREIEVFFIAAGCAGIKPLKLSCSSGGLLDVVCKKARVGPGEETKYFFKALTSNRQVAVYWCEGNSEAYETRTTKNKGSKKRCSVLNNGSQRLQLDLKCGYSESEFKAVKAAPLPK